ncbi:PASTA domain-containing protein, partial [Agromyces seonyuensis]
AAAAVPAVLGAGGATAATMLMPRGDGAPTAATQVLGTAAAAEALEGEEEEGEEKKRSPWTWPLIALISILAIVLIGTVIALLVNNGAQDDPPSTSPERTTATTRPTNTTTPSQTPKTVEVNEADYLGMNIDDAEAALEDLGLQVSRQAGSPATDPTAANTVSGVSPTGAVPAGDTVTLTYFTAAENPAAPSSGPTVAGAANPTAGTTITVNWAGQSCPAGQTLTGYSLSVLGDATVTGSGTFGPGTTSGSVAVANVPGGAFTMTFTYNCGSLVSPPSPTTNVTIAAATTPETTPAPPPTEDGAAQPPSASPSTD